MKAISLTQPWATLVAIGAKKVETRSWYTAHRGEIAIHAAKGLRPVGGMSGLTELCATSPFFQVLGGVAEVRGYGFRSLTSLKGHPMMPLGAIVAVARIVGCIPTNSQRPGSVPRGYNVARADRPPVVVTIPAKDSDEHAFGDYGPDRFMWFLDNVRALCEPVTCGGALSLWDVPADVEVEVRRQLAPSIGALAPSDAAVAQHSPDASEVVTAERSEAHSQPMHHLVSPELFNDSKGY